ncbi:MAG: helix-hairpin-helix domain-containing protein [Alphaproteobacteria bacterium]|nr:helix-hairpin-helix domain-containing protein [Alphaproteobacteria bacterium]
MIPALLTAVLLAGPASASSESPVAPAAGVATEARLDLNAADAASLAGLDGVGPGVADAIVSLREERGRLGSVEALRVLDLDEATLDALRAGTEVAVMPLVKTQGGKKYGSVDEVMAEFTGEPTITQVQQLAMNYSNTHPDMVARWLKASRSAFLLPRVDLKYRKDLYLNEDFDYIDDGGDQIRDTTTGDIDNNDVYEVKLQWNLQKLIMSSERIRVISESQDVAKLRDKTLEEVTRLFFDRRRHQIDMLLTPPTGLQDQIEAELRLQELTANLDAFTGGAFSAGLPAN